MEIDDLEKKVKHHLDTAEFLLETSRENAGGALTHNVGFWSGYYEAVLAIYDEMTMKEEDE